MLGRCMLALGCVLLSLRSDAFSQGSPICEVNTLPLIEMSATLSDPPPVGWTLSAPRNYYVPGRMVRFQVQQPNPAKRALGVLIWAKSAPFVGAGSFMLDAGGLYQFVPAPAPCAQWALSHVSPAPKSPAQLRFDWLPPNAGASNGVVIVRAFLIEACGVSGGCRAHQALTPVLVLQPALFVDGFEL